MAGAGGTAGIGIKLLTRKDTGAQQVAVFGALHAALCGSACRCLAYLCVRAAHHGLDVARRRDCGLAHEPPLMGARMRADHRDGAWRAGEALGHAPGKRHAAQGEARVHGISARLPVRLT